MSDYTGAGYNKRGLEYQNPFLDMTSCYLPKRIKSVLYLIAATIMSDSNVSICVKKGAEYPITELLYDGNSKSSLKENTTEMKWKDLIEKQMNILGSVCQSNMNEIGYGNSVVSINFPFQRYLYCPKCKKKHSLESIKVRFKNYKYYAKCKNKKCHYNGNMIVKDIDSKQIKKASFVHWDLLCMNIKFNNITSEHFYYYSPPLHLINSVKIGDLDIVNGLRWEIIDAISRVTKQIKLYKDNLFHFKREGPQYMIPGERGWGIPGPLAVLKDIFHCRILKKANEAIAFEHIVPLRILFPQSQGSASPHELVDMSDWKDTIESEILKYKEDPNRISILPIPLGIINLGGDAKMLLTTQEIKVCQEDIIIGMGFAPEIIKGGANYSGGSVSLRVVENTFMNTRKKDQDFIDWAVESLARYFKWPKISIKMSNFKMADDIQQKKLVYDMSQGPKPIISQDTVSHEFGFDPKEEDEKKLKEVNKESELLLKRTLSQAEAQGEAQIVSSLFSVDAESAVKNRTEYHTRKEQTEKVEQELGAEQENAAELAQEISELAKSFGMHPQQISMKKIITAYADQSFNLLRTDPKEFSRVMVKLKNDMPRLYSEVYNNLREMNVIEADLTPNLGKAQEQTPGELPQNVQGEISAETQPSISEQGGGQDQMGQEQVDTRPLPEQKPPRRDNPPV